MMVKRNMKKKLFIYAHSYSRYFCVEKVHFLEWVGGKLTIEDGGK